MRSPLGSIVGGSLSRGLTAHLVDEGADADLRAGSFVVVEDRGDAYFSLVSDLELGARDPGLLDIPVRPGSITEAALRGGALFTAATLKPSLVLRSGEEHPEPVRTIPRHFAPVLTASDEDYADVFGAASDPGHFAVGKPLGVDVDIPLDLRRLVERPSAIFGKTGTGKTFLTRLLLAGIVREDAAVTLVFDMHNEYGWAGNDKRTKGLRQLFPGRVQVFTLDEASSKRRGAKVDGVLTIAWEDLDETDLALLREELDLADAALDNVPLLQRHFHGSWLRGFVESDPASILELAESINANPNSLQSFYRKLQKLRKLPFLTDLSTAKKIQDALLGGMSVVLEFGGHENILAYALVANVLTRKLHREYIERTESDREKPPLVITIEEAHKFLEPSVAKLTTFGTIAREMRKYGVSLLIVDQRPSQIDREVLSQLGTRVLALLTDEADLDAALTGMPDPQRLRGIIASLDSQQQALLLGHALPMPIVVRTRSYDEQFYREMGGTLAPRKPAAPVVEPAPERPSAAPTPEDDAAMKALFGDR